jgi:hypothetical protein
VHQQHLQFRPKIELALAGKKVKGLNPHSIASENQTSFWFSPDSYRKHAAELRETICIPFQKCMQENFGV